MVTTINTSTGTLTSEIDVSFSPKNRDLTREDFGDDQVGYNNYVEGIRSIRNSMNKSKESARAPDLAENSDISDNS